LNTGFIQRNKWLQVLFVLTLSFTEMKLRLRLLLAFGLSFLILFLVSSTIILKVVQNNLKEKADAELSNVVQLLKGQVEIAMNASIKNYLKSNTEKAYQLAKIYYNKAINGEINMEEAKQNFEEILLNPDFGKIGDSGYMFASTRHGVLCMHPFSPGFDASGFEFMQKALQFDNGFVDYQWKNPNETKSREKSAYFLKFKPWDIHFGASAYTSEIAKIVDFNNLAHEEFRHEFLKTRIAENGYPYVLNTKGDLLIHPSQEGDNIYNIQGSDNAYFIQEICREKNGRLEYNMLSDDKSVVEKYVEFTYIPELDWIIAATANKSDVYAAYNRIKYISIFIICFAIVVLVSLTFIIAQRIVTPILHGVEIAKKISEGDLNVEIQSNRKDEIGDLVAALDFMTQKLREIVSNVKSGSEQMASASQQMAERASEQASSVEEVSSSAEEISANIEQNSDNAMQTNQIALQAVKQMSSGQESVEETLSAVRKIANDINLIQEIAEKTDLLAINASIEAARAGEHGKGFSVVATEVRKLAEKSQSTASSINRLSGDSLDVAEITEKVIKELVPEIQKTSKLIEEITAASSEQSTGIQQVNGALQELNMINQNNAAAAEEMAAQAENLNELISYFRL